MAIYKLLSDEVVLFRDDCRINDIEIDGKVQDVGGTLMLTNFNLVFTYLDEITGKISIVFSVNDIKIYNNTPQVKFAPHHADKVEIYLTNDELYLTFPNKKLAKTFVTDINKLLKGTPTFDSTLSKIKQGLNNAKQVINALDDAFGIDTVEMAKTAVVSSASKPSTGKGASVANAVKSAVLIGVNAIDTGIKSRQKKVANQLPAESQDELPATQTPIVIPFEPGIDEESDE